mmetsp:Transcript_8015/g.22363  ORF Transcript_8015/g.22363 Transcript_8015/m.22363 type:complete len:257 (-) Transcript_8015:235-1005(-)
MASSSALPQLQLSHALRPPQSSAAAARAAASTAGGGANTPPAPSSASRSSSSTISSSSSPSFRLIFTADEPPPPRLSLMGADLFDAGSRSVAFFFRAVRMRLVPSLRSDSAPSPARTKESFTGIKSTPLPPLLPPRISTWTAPPGARDETSEANAIGSYRPESSVALTRMVMLERLDDVPDTAVARSDLDFTEMERVPPSSFAGAVAPPRQITAVVGAGDIGWLGRRTCTVPVFGLWPKSSKMAGQASKKSREKHI